jgi:hypothetical protein
MRDAGHKVTRGRRAEIVRIAKRIWQRGQLFAWAVERIAEAIMEELPEVTPLEAWRFACGWTRQQVIDGIAALYIADGLAVPAVNSSMLCRWEHGELPPSDEYADALCRLYQAEAEQLGLVKSALKRASSAHCRRHHGECMRESLLNRAAPRTGKAYPTATANGDNKASALPAVLESIHLVLKIEGPAGGPFTREQLKLAIKSYALDYSMVPPVVLAAEVHRCRVLVINMLGQAQSACACSELRRIAGWLSALLGNLAFHLGSYPAACIHLGTAEQLGADVGDRRLISWALGAESMVARYQHRYSEALCLARKALEHAPTPLTRAQILAWAELPALTGLGMQNRAEAARVVAAAHREMEADCDGDQAGRFGFDMAEFELCVAEAHLAFKEPTHAAAHAQTSREHTTPGRPGWAAATLVLAASEVQRNRPECGAELAITVLDTVSPGSLRETARHRLALLEGMLGARDRLVPAARELHERLRTLPVQSPTADDILA